MHAVRHGLRLNADAMPPDPEKILQIHDFLGFGVSLRFLPTFTLILSLATLSNAPGDDFKVIALVWYTRNLHFRSGYFLDLSGCFAKTPALLASFDSPNSCLNRSPDPMDQI